MKKMSYYAFLLVVFLTFLMKPSAKSVVEITGTDVRIRNQATTNGSSILATVNIGDEFLLEDLNTGSAGNGCKKDWYKITYGSVSGYVCSLYATIKEIEEINPEDYAEYSDYLKELGFPDTYIPYLIELHKVRPNWLYKVMEVDFDFDYVVSKEHTSNGRSLIEDYNRTIDGYKSLESWSYSYLTDIFNTNFYGGGDRWYAASKETIAYYMDPRNFINEKQVFMFESQSYNSELHSKTGIEKMLKGTFMESTLADTENNKTYVDAFLDAAVGNNISPYVLISRVIQEVGNKGSTIVSGSVSGYEGYYNFYNINAAGDTAAETIANGLAKAKKEGWTTPYKAIVGGASFIKGNYLAVGQDTLYLNKWDLIGPDYFNHQYMQNIEAPAHESIKTYNAYKSMNLLDNELVFTIPVFKNMPNKTSLPHSGNPNNYLTSLSINGNYLFKTATTETEFEQNLSMTTTSIEIAATKVSSKAKINGLGSISLTGSEQLIPITVTAENGDIRTYNIKITRTVEIALAISEILNISNIKNDGTYIYGSEVGTDISKIKQTIIDTEAKAEVSTTDKDGKSKINGIIASGDKLKIKTATEEKEYTFIVYGDVNSDGAINKVDAAAILRHYYKYTSYDGAQKIAADVNQDEAIDKVDVAAVLRHLYGYATIKQ